MKQGRADRSVIVAAKVFGEDGDHSASPSGSLKLGAPGGIRLVVDHQRVIDRSALTRQRPGGESERTGAPGHGAVRITQADPVAEPLQDRERLWAERFGAAGREVVDGLLGPVQVVGQRRVVRYRRALHNGNTRASSTLLYGVG